MKSGRLKASFTVEAALVMSIVLLTITALILHAFSLHDETMAGSVLLYTLESYAHRNQNEETDDTDTFSQDNTQYFQKTPSEIRMDEDLVDLKLIAESDWDGETMKAEKIRPKIETLMRLITVKDGLDKKKDKEGETGSNEDL